MADPFLGEIRMFAGNFAPAGWALCNGRLLPISENDALYALLGTIYGGDGVTTFALPNLQGRVAVGLGTGPGLTTVNIGELAGVESVTLTANQLPSHTHSVQASTNVGTTDTPTATTVLSAAGPSTTTLTPYATSGTLTAMSPASTTPAGNSLPHENMQPYLAINYIIALQGVFPSQN